MGETMTDPDAAVPPAEQATPAGTPHHPQPLAWPIITSRLFIRPMIAVWDQHVDALNDKYHMRFSEQRFIDHTRMTQRRYIDSAPGKLLLPLDLATAVESIGSMSCHLDFNNRVVNLGIMIIPTQAKQRYGFEAWSYVMQRWLRDDWKVEAGCRGDHYAMRSIMVRSGMLHEGTLLNHFLLEDGSRANCLLYGRCP